MPEQKCKMCGKVWDYHTNYGGYCIDCEKIVYTRKLKADKITFWAFAILVLIIVYYVIK